LLRGNYDPPTEVVLVLRIPVQPYPIPVERNYQPIDTIDFQQIGDRAQEFPVMLDLLIDV
jgi:hypothetical protein